MLDIIKFFDLKKGPTKYTILLEMYDESLNPKILKNKNKIDIIKN